ncbi:hypothetical protein [uncultured Sphingomonas sp.]|uniref:hypothetical protein n=1 Tax=uncultured Sphingomonas sp. TaxID=158754 RepID=UPI0035C99ADF
MYHERAGSTHVGDASDWTWTRFDEPRWARTRSTRRLALCITLALVVGFFFRDAIGTGLTGLYGDSYDGLIEISILEHWYAVVARGASWSEVGYFHPYPATLGYNDTYLVPGVFYAAARLLGADPFLSAFASHVAMKAIGFLGMYVLLRRGTGVRTGLALAGAALFATANASLLHMLHGQLLSVGLLPWLGFVAIRTAQALAASDGRALYRSGVALALLYGLTAFNAFYAAWFFAFFMMLFTAVGVVAAGPRRRATLLRSIRRQAVPIAVLLVVALLALLPLFALYLPKIAQGARHDWTEGASRFLLSPSTLVNVGGGNLVWGGLLDGGIQALTGHPPFRGEARFGITPGLIVVAAAATVWAARDRSRGRLALALGCTLAVALLLMARGPGGFTLWRHVYDLVPGADTVRVVSRFLLFALVPVILIVTIFLDRSGRRPRTVAAVVAFLLFEQIQLGAPLAVDRPREMAMLSSVGAPPANCRAFFVVSARPDGRDVLAEAKRISRAWNDEPARDLAANYRHNVDAMLLASYYGRPTINGFSSFQPPDWAFGSPDSPDYAKRVRDYAARHRITGLCGLDRRRRPHWFKLAPDASGR